MNIERYDYPSQYVNGTTKLSVDIASMLEKGELILSKHVGAFEKSFSEFLGVTHTRGVNSGTDALVIALRALNIGPGDEVITQANTFYATVAAIRLVGATPVLVDAEPDSYLIDQVLLSEAITSSTKAIIPVHLYGKPTPMAPLMEIAKKHNLYVIEDSAQAHGASIEGKCVGTFGDFGCFSFHPSKNLGAAGDAGAICTNSAELALTCDELRSLGQNEQNEHSRLGLNSKLDAIQARVLLEKLPELAKWNRKRRKLAKLYQERLDTLPLAYQKPSADEKHVYHLFQIDVKTRRNELQSFLRQSGVDAVVRYPYAIHQQKAFEDMGWVTGQFSVAEHLAANLLCLPLHPSMDTNSIDFVFDHIKKWFKNN